jgi:ATP-dependent DNA helicase RecG
VSIFYNRIEIVSIGGLVPGISLDDILLGISQPRNEKLAGIFYRLRHVEAYGTGIGKIRRDYEGTGLVPTFTVTDGAFLLVLPNKNYPGENLPHQNITRSERSFDRDLEDRILNLAAVKGFLTRKMIEAELGLKQTKAGMMLKRLEAKGLLGKTGAGRSTRFYLKK